MIVKDTGLRPAPRQASGAWTPPIKESGPGRGAPGGVWGSAPIRYR